MTNSLYETENKAVGIVCEYNPFHFGHAYQIEYIKNTLKKPCVCVMSGNFTQRAEPASADKFTRAQMAVNNGADIVLELPFPFCSMTAEKFAEAGVDILAKSGMCSHIAFGSECADIEALEKISEFLLSEECEKCIQVHRTKYPEKGYAEIRQEVIECKLGKKYAEICSNPNDILGIEYIKAIKKNNYPLVPVAVKRTVLRKDRTNGEYASSSYIRALVGSGKSAKAYMPDFEEYKKARIDTKKFGKALLLLLKAKRPEDVVDIAEVSTGLEHKIIKAAKKAKDYGCLCWMLKCKTLTDAKIRRMILFSALGVDKKMYEKNVKYTGILKMSEGETAKKLMRICSKERQIIVAQRVSAIRKDKEAFSQYEFCESVEKLLEYVCEM